MTQQQMPQTGGQSTQYMGGGKQGTQQTGTGPKTMSKTLPDAHWSGLTSVAQAIAVCEFCADQCIQEADPMMIECIKQCEDVADIGKSVLSLVPHQSRNAQQVLQAFQQAVQSCAQECSQHQHAHCQECARVLSQVQETIPQLQGTGQQGRKQGGQAQPFQGGQGQQFQGGQSLQGGATGMQQY